MDVERTIEFILEQQASMTSRQDAILKLIEAGMKLIGEHDRQIKLLIEGQQRLTESQQRLTASQQETEEKLKRLIDALLRNRTNGR